MLFFFFNDTATTEIYPLSLHDALPICGQRGGRRRGHASYNHPTPAVASRAAGVFALRVVAKPQVTGRSRHARPRSEEHTSELQSRQYLVCRLLLEKKNNNERTTVSCTC